MSPRKQLATRLFDEGLAEVDRLGLVTCDPDRFFPLITLRTGLTDGAYGGLNKKRLPYIYIGTRYDGFNKEQAMRNNQAYRGNEKSWGQARELAKQGKWQYVEYGHINNDPEIGAFVSDNPEDHVRALVAHELAHAVHWWEMEQGKPADRTEHGPAWQAIYRTLRREWVNPKIKSD